MSEFKLTKKPATRADPILKLTAIGYTLMAIRFDVDLALLRDFKQNFKVKFLSGTTWAFSA